MLPSPEEKLRIGMLLRQEVDACRYAVSTPSVPPKRRSSEYRFYTFASPKRSRNNMAARKAT